MRGITLRITLLGWLVTLLTLAVFVTVIVPQQEAEFKLNLESKARGVAASIKAVAAGAAVSEDYSMIVDQAMQVLAGDQAIDFIVITKNDGFSVVTDRSQWKTDNLSGQWRPQARVPSSSIGVVPLFGRRVFQYATPFDYSGIEWGWVHVGLSLESYDMSVRRSYQRTGALALACVVLSLGVSLAFAKRLVKPVHELHRAVEKVASGDLAARADVRSGDEVELLAGAFNVMAGTILARNRVLEAVSFTAQELMSAPDWRLALGPVLESAGKASSASRAYVVEAGSGLGGRKFQTCQEWTQPDVEPAGMFWDGLDSGGGEFAEGLRRQQAVVLQPGAELSPSWKLHESVRSMLAIPIHTGEQWWGFLGLDDCDSAREWGAADKDSLRAVANMLGSTIMRQCAEADLIEAKATLERRVAERTQELQEQVEAKDRAHAELAEAQQRMLQISRQAGMAEVATGVLHNVGNVLNSVNVTTTFVLEKLQQSRVDKLASVTGLLTANAGRLGEFLAADPKGSQVLPYLEKLSAHLVKERDGMVSELGSLSRHVGHIKEIVSAQQGYASTSGFVEKVQISKLLDDALALAQDGLSRHDIKVTRQFGHLPEVLTDKHKVLQIVLNLVRNARDATREASRPDREIRVSLDRTGDRFRIAVADNGIGLRAEDLNRIFQHGFTTKRGGHGFGLHSGALAARDLGGSLTASSDGPGQGAVFTLDLPLVAKGSREGQKA